MSEAIHGDKEVAKYGSSGARPGTNLRFGCDESPGAQPAGSPAGRERVTRTTLGTDETWGRETE